MKNPVGLKEFRANLNKVANRVKKGESIVVWKHSEPLFKVVPLNHEEEQWEAVIDFTKLKKGGINIDDILTRL